jgi:hypothetical protein
VPVILGIETTVQLGTAKGTRFEAFTLSNVSVEAASNSISKSFMNVRVYPSGVSTPEVWARIENIRLADPYDKVYEVKYLTSSGNVLIKFGDGYTGQRLPALARVEFDFLDTKGEDGNLEDKFQITTIILPGGTSQVDPRTNDQVEFLSCTNISPILGGKFVESEDDFRVNAPVSYLKSYTTSTMQSYYEKIFKYSPVSLLTLRLFNSDVVSATSVGQSSSNDNFVSTIDTDVFTEILTKRSAIYISAIRSNGTKFDDPDAELIEPLERALVDYKSPGDSFQYLEPNFIQLRPNIIVGTYDSINEATVRAEVISKIMSKYSIFNTDFEKPYYSSVINDLVSELSYVSYVKLQLEARATVASKPIVTKSDSPATPDVCLFEFKFDPSFANDKLNAGFKNFLTKTQYVLRADVAFSSRPSASRTFVLLDSRDSTLDAITLYDALTTPITTTKIMPSYTVATYDEVKAPNLSERENSFANRQSRTAQFPYISKIITDSYLNRMLSFSIEPFEIRPLHVDTTGANKQFVKDEVVESDRVSLNLTSTGADATGDYVYKIDSNYYEYAQLLYTENYQQPNSADYAHGYFVIQLSDLLDDEQYANLEKLREDSADSFDVAAEVEKLITGSVSISVWAQPIASDFETVNPNDIIFTAGDEIVVEKQYLTAR